MMGLISNNIINFNKISISNINGYGSYIPLIIANNYTASKLTSNLLTSLSD